MTYSLKYSKIFRGGSSTNRVSPVTNYIKCVDRGGYIDLEFEICSKGGGNTTRIVELAHADIVRLFGKIPVSQSSFEKSLKHIEKVGEVLSSKK